METIIDRWEEPSLPVVETDARFPVRRLFCVGQNYVAHAREMGGDPNRQPPCFFCKPSTSVVADGGAVPYPPATSNLHHEVELVVALSQGGSCIPLERALTCVFGFAVGLDLTRRDLQAEAKKAGRPWDMAKGFDAAAPIGELHPASELEGFSELSPDTGGLVGAIELSVNGERRQSGDLSQMTWGVGEIISQLSTLLTLMPGDLIFTGTPSGVGPVERGDQIVARIQGVGELRVAIV